MARVVGALAGNDTFTLEYFPTAAVTAGQVLVVEATASNAGEAADPAGTGSGGVTDVLDMLGVAENAATIDTTPAIKPGTLLQSTDGSLENLVRVVCNPLAIYNFKISGGATSGTALVVATTTPSHYLTNDTADSAAPYATITETSVGTVDMSGGLVKGVSGNNLGAIRKLTSQVNSTSCTVSTGFVNTIAVGDEFIRVPYSRAVVGMQTTSDFTEANGIIAVGALGPWAVKEVIIDEQRGVAYVHVLSRDHIFNPLS